ncbi:hypothetical protein [Cumulibacter manganitolerans]|uniref:hypothetical protein n=1 Tax=Cumulibacter manganitolerans TaxID=1884992 RepID=UPI001E34195B|nr:hypothetical protein [Cumulibacter manganitolerans]
MKDTEQQPTTEVTASEATSSTPVEPTAVTTTEAEPVTAPGAGGATAERTSPRVSRSARLGAGLDRGWDHVDGAWGRVGAATLASPVGRWWKRVERPGIADWVILAATLVLAYFTFLYGDVKATFEHSFNFLDSLFAGRPQDFYQIAIDHSTYGHPAVYDIPIYLIFGIWNLPTYLFYKFGDFDYLNSTPALLWLKLMIVVFALISARLMMSIGRTMGLPAARSKWVAFYFLSSMALFVPVFVTVQYDIISVTFMLAGILAYMQGRTRAFLLWFLAANTLKLFGLFVFIPLVLLREKRLPRAAGQIIVGVLGLLFCRLLYRGNLAFQISTGGFTDEMLNRLTVAGFTWQSNITVPLFVVFMVGLTIFAYVKRPVTERQVQAFAIYVSLAAFLVFCAIVPLNPYWIALVSPFTVLIIFANPRHFTLNSILETGLGTSLMVLYLMVGYSMYNSGTFKDLAFGAVVPPASPQRFGTPAELLRAAGLEQNKIPFLVGFMLACVLAVLVLNYPRTEFLVGMPNLETISRSVVWLRLAAMLGFCALLFGFYLLPAPPTAYSSASPAPVDTQVDILKPGASVEEEISFDRTLKVTALQIGLNASAVTWIDSSEVNVAILDEAGKPVFHTSAAANAIGVGYATFPTDGLTLKAGETYTLRLTGDHSEGAPVTVQINPAQDKFKTTADGATIPGDIVMVLQGSKQ